MRAEKDPKTGKWLIQYRYTDWQGKRRKSTKRGFKTKREAEEWLRNFLMTQTSDFDMKFDEFLKLYYADMETRLREHTMRTKKYIIELKILPYFGQKRINDIKAADIRNWQNELIKQGYRNKLKEPLIKLRVASENIANNDLDFRVDYHSKDELGQLCVSFEIMRSTLESNFSEMWRQMEERKQLNAAFAHDLRTPLTVLKGYDEMLQSSSDSITRDIAETMGKHIFRLERYVDSMSQLHRLEDARPQALLLSTVYTAS